MCVALFVSRTHDIAHFRCRLSSAVSTPSLLPENIFNVHTSVCFRSLPKSIKLLLAFSSSPSHQHSVQLLHKKMSVSLYVWLSAFSENSDLGTTWLLCAIKQQGLRTMEDRKASTFVLMWRPMIESLLKDCDKHVAWAPEILALLARCILRVEQLENMC